MILPEKIVTDADVEIVIDVERHTLVAITPEMIARASDIGRRRHESKQSNFKDYKRLDPLNPHQENIFGCLLEVVFEAHTGLAMNDAILPAGDDGFDFMCGENYIGVCAARKPTWLILRADRQSKADYLVLGTIDKKRDFALFLGWNARLEMLMQPTKVLNKNLGFLNHIKPRDQLYPAPELFDWVKRVKSGNSE